MVTPGWGSQHVQRSRIRPVIAQRFNGKTQALNHVGDMFVTTRSGLNKCGFHGGVATAKKPLLSKKKTRRYAILFVRVMRTKWSCVVCAGVNPADY